MSTTGKARIYGAREDLIECDGAIYGEAGWYSDRPAKITLKAPDGTKMRLAAQFCGGDNVEGCAVTVKDNPGLWAVAEFKSREREDDEGCDYGVIVDVPEGTTAKCNGERVR